MVGELEAEEGHFCEQWLEGDGLMEREDFRVWGKLGLWRGRLGLLIE